MLANGDEENDKMRTDFLLGHANGIHADTKLLKIGSLGNATHTRINSLGTMKTTRRAEILAKSAIYSNCSHWYL